MAREPVDPDNRQGKADEQRGQPLHRAFAKGGGDGDKGQHHQREVFARAKDEGEFDDVGGKEGQGQRGQKPGDKGADGGGGQGGAAPPGAGHLVALKRGHNRRTFARCIKKD